MTNSILWGQTINEIDNDNSITISHSIVDGGFDGSSILDVDKEWVTVHVGLKSEGVISLDEVLVVLDCAYFEYVTEEDYVKPLDLLNEFDNLLITKTFSKIHGLASIRVGYGIANPSLIEVLNGEGEVLVRPVQKSKKRI